MSALLYPIRRMLSRRADVLSSPQNPVGYHVAQLRTMTDPEYRGPKPPITPGERVLDIGCGAGQTLIASCPGRHPSDRTEGHGAPGCPLCETPCSGRWAYGIDIDEAALRVGSQWSDRISYTRGKAEVLPYRAASFDHVISRVAVPYMVPEKVVSEIKRILRPGGRVWLVMHPLRSRSQRAMQHTWKGKLFFLYVLLNGIIFHLTLNTFRVGGYRESWQSRSAMLRLMRRRGFENVRTETAEPWFVVTAQRPSIPE